jgi:hypothetical protein
MQTETFLNCTLEQSLLLEELGLRSSMRCPSTSTVKAWLFLEYGIFIQTERIKYNYSVNTTYIYSADVYGSNIYVTLETSDLDNNVVLSHLYRLELRLLTTILERIKEQITCNK